MSAREVDYLLVGGGLASANCARWLRQEGAEGEVLVVGRELDPPYNRPECSKGYLRGEETREEPLFRPAEWWKEQKIELLTGTTVTKLDPGTRTATLSNKQELRYGKALLASGANVRRLNVEGSELENIYYLRTLGNADAIRAGVQDAEEVVLIGGSYIGCEVAASLTMMGKRCSIVMQEQLTLERGFGRQAGRFFQDLLEQHGVRVHPGQELDRFEGSGRVAAVHTKSGLELPAQAVVIGAGVIPELGLARRAGLEIGELGGVTCNSRLASSAAGVFAAGDICEYESVVHGGRSLRIEHWDVAFNQGKTAALNMLGRDVPHDVVPYFYSVLGDWGELEYVGPASQWDAEIVRGSTDAATFTTWYLAGGRVAAALTVGRSDDLDHARRLMAGGVELDEQAQPGARGPRRRPFLGRVATCPPSGSIPSRQSRWSREAGENPERSRHCDRGCPPQREPSASAATGSANGGPGRCERVGPEARRPAADESPQALAERGRLMHPSSRLAPVAVAALAALLFCSAPALASGPSSVIVRVEGDTHTLVGPVQVLTPEQPVSAAATPEDSCPGNSALGALAVASGGAWGGTFYEEFGGYAIESVAGESHTFSSGSFWDVWFGHRESALGLCDILAPESGSEVLLFPCSASASSCPSPLAISAPASANVGEPVTVDVISYASFGASAPASGASVTGAATPVTTASDGSATVTFATAGEETLAVSAPEAVRDEVQVCVHRGEDGTCGTVTHSLPGKGSAQTGSGPSSGTDAFYTGPYAVVARFSSVDNGVTYTRARAPRLLAGTVTTHTAVTSVALELRRSYRGRCSSYDAVRARFVAARCGKGRSFHVASSASFSYLLPERLGPGRYVLDVSALDAAGNHTTLARGTSRLVFYVR